MGRPHLKHYSVVGRETPTDANPNPTVYKYEVFAPNFVVAKSRFWRLMNDKNKVKSTKGDILECKIVKDRKIGARNYAVNICYYSQQSGYVQMHKEFRDVSKAGAVSQAVNDLASRHRARFNNIEVLNVKSIAESECRRPSVIQFHNTKLAFPIVQRKPKAAHKDRAIFVRKGCKRVVVA